jgi:hypothetical protein
MQMMIDADAQRRREEARRLNIVQSIESWEVICRRAMPSDFSNFEPFLYSFDLVVPLLDLRQKSRWTPRVIDNNGHTIQLGELTRYWQWFQILFGLFLSVILAGTVSGIIRKD